MPKIASLVGARPQFVKEAVLGARARETRAWDHVLVHSGQHYDRNMSDIFFSELSIGPPKHVLGVGSGSHAAMTAAILVAVEGVLLQERPDGLLVYGDTNTTLAGALAAAKPAIPVIHVEAGIRMRPRTMPEEINRVVTDHLASVHCCCSEKGRVQLAREGLMSAVSNTGDIMLDVFLRMRPRFSPDAACAARGMKPGGFVVVTPHRDYNVDDDARLRELVEGLRRFARESGLKALFAVHPRTRARLRTLLGRSPEDDGVSSFPEIAFLPPLGYVELMSLVSAAALVITDSGGLQKEAFYAGRRCVVVMPDTGWSELVDSGWNILAEPVADDLVRAGLEGLRPHAMPEGVYGDGRAADRVIDAVKGFLAG